MADHHGSLKSIFYAFSANMVIAVAKTFTAWYTGSGSMMAESVHSYADTGNQLLLLWGMKRSKKAPTREHPLGYGMAIYFWSFIVALMLFSIGGMFSVYEGIHKAMEPAEINNQYWALGVLAFSLVAESLSLAGALRIVKKLRKDRSFWKWYKDTKRSELLVVLGEDTAAVTGLFFAMIAIGVSMITDNPVYDAYGSIVIGLLLIFVAVQLGVKIKSLMIGESASKELETAITGVLLDSGKISRIFNMISVQLGAEVMLALKVEMKEKKEAGRMIDDINFCEKKIKSTFPEVKWIFFEPDNTD
jgi:cation diffusion facilitator family transporter